MKEVKSMKGITLVSLVITVIVLIILAAVSINLTIGTDGIITKAKEAAENMELAAVEEQVRLNELYGQLDGSVESGGLAYDKIAQLKEQYDNLNTEYTDFKTQIAQAITNKGVETSSTDSAATMVSNIESIAGSNFSVEAVAGQIENENSATTYTYTATKSGKVIVTLIACFGSDGDVTEFYCKKNNEILEKENDYAEPSGKRQLTCFIIDVVEGDVVTFKSDASGGYADNGYTICFVG